MLILKESLTQTKYIFKYQCCDWNTGPLYGNQQSSSPKRVFNLLPIFLLVFWPSAFGSRLGVAPTLLTKITLWNVYLNRNGSCDLLVPCSVKWDPRGVERVKVSRAAGGRGLLCVANVRWLELSGGSYQVVVDHPLNQGLATYSSRAAWNSLIKSTQILFAQHF